MQFDAVIVITSVLHDMFGSKHLLGYKELTQAEIKWLHFFAMLYESSAPTCQKPKVGSTLLCIPLVEALYPHAMQLWALFHVKPVACMGLRQTAGQVIEVCPSLMLKPQE